MYQDITKIISTVKLTEFQTAKLFILNSTHDTVHVNNNLFFAYLNKKKKKKRRRKEGG